MRKHRFYGVVLAMLLGVGVFTHSPISKHNQSQSTKSTTSSPNSFAGAQLTSLRGSSAREWQLLGPYSKTRSRPGTTEIRDPSQIGWAALVLELPAPPPPAAPVVQTAAFTASAPPAPAPAPAPPSGDVWAQLRQCESEGNYADNTGNGYYGAYQFSLSTWQSLGYSGLTSDAPAATQDQAAQQLQAASGWGQWPACASELGLV